MRPVILSSPAKVATGLAMGCAHAGAASANNASPSKGTNVLDNFSKMTWLGRNAPRSLFGRPGVVVAGNAGAFALVEQAAIRTVGSGRAGQVGLVRLFPGMGGVIGLRRHHVG